MPITVSLNASFFEECPTFEAFLAKVTELRRMQGSQDSLTDDDLMAKLWLYYSNADEVAPRLMGESGITTLDKASEAVLKQLRKRLLFEFGQSYLKFVEHSRVDL